MKLDAFDYLKKPFDLNDLRRALNNAQKTYCLIGSSKDKLKSSVGKKLKFLRKSKRITQKQLANRTSLSPSLLSQIENGQIAASLTTLDKLSALNVKNQFLCLMYKISYFLDEEAVEVEPTLQLNRLFLGYQAFIQRYFCRSFTEWTI